MRSTGRQRSSRRHANRRISESAPGLTLCRGAANKMAHGSGLMEQTAATEAARAAQQVACSRSRRCAALPCLPSFSSTSSFTSANKLQRPDFLPQFNIGAASVDVFFVHFRLHHGLRLRAPVRAAGRHAHLLPAPRWHASCRCTGSRPRSCSSTSSAALRQLSATRPAARASTYVICLVSVLSPTCRPHGWGVPLLGVGWTLIYEVLLLHAVRFPGDAAAPHGRPDDRGVLRAR